MNEIFTGIVSSLSSLGHGIIKNGTFVIFVPFTAPGDLISYQIVKIKKNFGFGKLIEFLTPGKERTLPKCPYFGTCGGCDLQHLNLDAQCKAKRQWIEDALVRIGGFNDVTVPEVIPANNEWGYRRRINMILKPLHGSYQAGYTAIDHSFLKVSRCPIFVDLRGQVHCQEFNVITALQKCVSQLKPKSSEDARAIILKTFNDKYILHFDFLHLPDNIDSLKSTSPHFALQEFKEKIEGISISSHKQNLQFGKTEQQMDIDGLQINFSPKTFIQAHHEQSLNIYKKVEKIAIDLKPSKVLDLYSGIGISSLLIARQGALVTGIEFNKEAVRLATHNAKINNLQKTKFIAASVEDVLESHLADAPDLVIVNPPREGLETEAINSLCRHKAKTLVYISCMPSTLARDLKKLKDSGYSLSYIQPYDMFPQTRHVETLAVLKS